MEGGGKSREAMLSECQSTRAGGAHAELGEVVQVGLGAAGEVEHLVRDGGHHGLLHQARRALGMHARRHQGHHSRGARILGQLFALLDLHMAQWQALSMAFEALSCYAIILGVQAGSLPQA